MLARTNRKLTPTTAQRNEDRKTIKYKGKEANVRKAKQNPNILSLDLTTATSDDI